MLCEVYHIKRPKSVKTRSFIPFIKLKLFLRFSATAELEDTHKSIFNPL